MALYTAGLDIGSTTVKIVILDEKRATVFSAYRRHYADINTAVSKLLEDSFALLPEDSLISLMLTGSAGIAAATCLKLPFTQEVAAGLTALNTLLPEADVAIELGGEDAKITYLGASVEQRMNGACAGGTGAFLDQMASLLETDLAGLDALAAEADTFYPIASRCGVFAKSDVQPLLNEGAAKSDIAASIMQSVVNQTISGLACGRPIRGKVAFLGGPLHFLPQLRRRFIETLHLTEEEILFPENAQLFIAMGAALEAGEKQALTKREILQHLPQLQTRKAENSRLLAPLFATDEEYEDFCRRHNDEGIAEGDPAELVGPCWLGIDAGSTTVKLALVDQEKRLVFSYYSNNGGKPVETVIQALTQLYAQLPKQAYIVHTCVTGYGEALIQAGLKADMGEIETVAHYRAAKELLGQVSCVLDIGGQDMKCLFIKEDNIDRIQLNEACSSGCGSFIETFARSMGLTAADFARLAIKAQRPVDLGSRCTVFMNSQVKQAQKEGATQGDIAAGLSYSVIKNALFKVIKLHDPQELGSKVIVQGGTFMNDAVLRAFELISGHDAYRPKQAGLMGAYGAALLAFDTAPALIPEQEKRSSLLNEAELAGFTMEKSTAHCCGCGNKCLLTVTAFADGSKHISNNRCECYRLAGDAPFHGADTKENLYEYKYRRLLRYQPLPAEQAPRGIIGIPRALNIYENYPFWFTLLSELGFSVYLSPRSSRQLFEKGMETMPSESVCYPARLAHGHIEALLEKGIKNIFFPCLPKEEDEGLGGVNHYNCPIVATYPELLRNNVPGLHREDVRYICPFLPYDNKKRLHKRLLEELAPFHVKAKELRRAIKLACAEDAAFKADIRDRGARLAEKLEREGRTGIVLAGRPYHVDPEINHGIARMIADLGFAVLTEDSIAHLGRLPRPIKTVDQWMYHTRLYQAADAVSRHSSLELVQLTSFGCGLDAITTDQVQEILERGHKLYTLIKIDEVSNLGAARIRMRSLAAALKKRGIRRPAPADRPKLWPVFTRSMRQGYTVLAPQMSPTHFQLIEKAFAVTGMDFRILPTADAEDIATGLRYVNNDACYPAIITIGQLLHALQSGNYDPDHTALMITQTGGGCRATNYIALLRRALEKAGHPQVPVISLSLGLEKSPGFKLTLPLLRRALFAVSIGDHLDRLLHQTRPYEKEPGSANALREEFLAQAGELIPHIKRSSYRKLINKMIDAFAALPRTDTYKPRVGLVGEILVKYHPDANNHAVEVIEAEGGEAVVPDLMGFFQYGFLNGIYRACELSGSKGDVLRNRLLIRYTDTFRRPFRKKLEKAGFRNPHSIYHLAKSAGEVVGLGNMCGEGWFLSGEMIDMIHEGIDSIACVQPFACLPNHVVGKGAIRAIRDRYPAANIVAVDYDPGSSQVNQLNRLKLMMSIAKKKASVSPQH